MSKVFGELPAGAAKNIVPFTANVADEKLQEFKALLKLSKLPPPTYESLQEDRRYGVTSKWMSETKEYWLNQFDWRQSEDHINSFPNFMANIEDDDGDKFQVHFTAIFSKNPNAVPVIGIHGWPGSFLEFLPMMDLLRKKYTPEDLPYHFINPSMTGYAYSSPPPLTKNWLVADTTRLLNKLMHSLGFSSYISTGGDIGATVARIMAGKYDECKGVLLNFCTVAPPEPFHAMSPADDIIAQGDYDEGEKKGLKRREAFLTKGHAYAAEHGTRTSTIGHVLTSSPLALLAWVGEKFLEWSDTDPSIDDILESVTLWWLNETHPKAIYPYRQNQELTNVGLTHNDLFVPKPLGYQWFPLEIMPAPKKWVERTGHLEYYRRHDSGGHFAAFEKPDIMMQEIGEFVDHVKSKGATF